jgi:riboflavin synthase
MFTGIIRCLGTLSRVRPAAAGRGLTIAARELTADLDEGDSVAVNGVCLTVTGVKGDEFEAFAGVETCQRTTLGSLPVGAVVNLEPALKAGEEIGGHLVQGHVDGTGRLMSLSREGDTVRLVFTAEAELLAEIVPRGSVAVDGISLTVTRVDNFGFDVAVIPYTWHHTNLRYLREGDMVNIETDILAKYVRRFVCQGSGAKGITREFLAEHGYL